MIIIGDLALPSNKYVNLLEESFRKLNHIFKNKEIIANLEGLITDDIEINQSLPVLFNHNSILNFFKKWNFNLLVLANNHTLDLPQNWHYTRMCLNEHSIKYAGVGSSWEEAAKPVIFTSNGKQIILFNQCWHVLLHHQKNPSAKVYVNPINEKKLFENISSYKNRYPLASIIVYFHWNYDLELLPFPLHRKLARDLIDSGVNVVIGNHAHCVQGGEKYKDGYIVYGLGNFFMPWHTFIGGKLDFPDFAKTEMAFEWEPVTNSAIVHFFKYEPENDKHILNHIESADFEDSIILKSLSSYIGMKENEYILYFKKNRRKKLLVPVYKNYHHHFSNNIKDLILITRMRFARSIATVKLRKWNN